MYTHLKYALKVTLLTLSLPSAPASAMSVTPTVIELTTSGNERTSQITVMNDGASPLPVEIVITRIDLDEKGAMSTTPAGDEFLVFPPQALVKGGMTQNFRVQWVSEPSISESRSYKFSVNQVPVKMPEGKSGVQVVFNFGCIVNVAPLSGTSSLQLVNSGVGTDPKGALRPEITVRNGGNIHAKLTDATIKLSSASWSQTFTPEQVKQMVGVGLVQPGKARKFQLPVELPAGASTVTAQIDYKRNK